MALGLSPAGGRATPSPASRPTAAPIEDLLREALQGVGRMTGDADEPVDPDADA